MKKPPFEKSRGKKRGPERSVDIELSSPARARKKKNDTDLVSFFFQARDGDRTRKAFLTEMPKIQEMLINTVFAITFEMYYAR